MDDLIETRKQKILDFLLKKKMIIIFLLFAVIAIFGFYLRMQNVPLTVDITTNDHIPIEPDSFAFLRYAKYIVEHGELMDVDTMRYHPYGFTGVDEFAFLSYATAYFYKFLHFFDPSVTIGYAQLIYPPVAFVIGLFFFFLLVRKIFDWRVALLASTFLAVIPAYLYRTIAGFSDKEALALIFMYASLYFFISSFVEKKTKRALVYTILAGLSVGAMWLQWGGTVFIILTIGSFVILQLLLGKFTYRNLYLYTLFVFISLLILRLGFPERFGLGGLMTSVTSSAMFLALFSGWVWYIFFEKNVLKLKDKIKIPSQIAAFLIVIIASLVLLIVSFGPGFITSWISYTFTLITQPQLVSRWSLTVAESHQPYFTDWASQFNWTFLILAFCGVLFLFYSLIKSLGKRAYTFTGLFAILLLALVFSRYSPSSRLLNGNTNFSYFIYIGIPLLILAYFGWTLYTFYKKESQSFATFRAEFNESYLFILIFTVLMILAARSAIRLFIIFAPVTAMLVAYAIFSIVSLSLAWKEKLLRYGAWIGVFVISFILLSNFAETTSNQAKGSGTSYTPQWQEAMKWVRESTPQDAVFAHWWDYGYYVQTGGERATLSDGGNAMSAINHFTGRHLLTAQNETEALELLAAYNATHVLIVSDEVGKYGAFSAIGADENYDRYSWIPAFTLDLSQSQETRNGSTLVYTGSTMLDDDFVYQGKVFPAYGAGIAGFMVPLVQDNNGTVLGVMQPSAALIHPDGTRLLVPLKCLFINGEQKQFGGEGLDACLQIVPIYQGSGQLNQLGGALYLSPEVSRTLFTHLYLFGEQWDNFKLVYSDEKSVPLMFYQGRLFGPIKIWEVSYPDNLKIPEEYLKNDIADKEVTKVKKGFY